MADLPLREPEPSRGGGRERGEECPGKGGCHVMRE
jgi:hypothetical protein